MANEFIKENLKTKYDKILFNKNWNNKLFNDVFTSIRLPSSKFFLGKNYSIVHQLEYCFDATLIDLKSILLNDLPPYTCYLDTGLSKPETIQLIRSVYEPTEVDLNTKPLAILLLKKI